MGSVIKRIEKTRSQTAIVITDEGEWEQFKHEYMKQERSYCNRYLMVPWAVYKTTINAKFNSGVIMYRGTLVVRKLSTTERKVA